MSIGLVVVLCLVFGIIFFLAGKHLTGTTRQLVKFLAGAIIVAALLIFLLGLFGISLR